MSLSWSKCSKLLVIFCNVFFSWISGALLVLFGVIYLYDPSYLHYYTLITVNAYPQYYFIVFSLSIIALGGFIITLGLFGCFGTLCENNCIVKTYIYLLFVVFLIEAGLGGCSLYLYLTFPAGQQQSNLYNEVREEYGSFNASQTPFNSAVDFTQSNLNCCGVYNYTDYDWSSWKNSMVDKIDLKVPGSCCSDKPIIRQVVPELDLEGVTETSSEVWAKCQSGDPMESDDYLYVQGCWSQLADVLNMNTLFAAILFGSLAILQILGVILPICWVKRLERKSRLVRRNTRQADPLL